MESARGRCGERGGWPEVLRLLGGLLLLTQRRGTAWPMIALGYGDAREGWQRRLLVIAVYRHAGHSRRGEVARTQQLSADRANHVHLIILRAVPPRQAQAHRDARVSHGRR